MDTGFVEISTNDNIMVLAGQNESGKSSVLKALRDYENNSFDTESIPFSTNEDVFPIVSCTYLIEDEDNIVELLTNKIIEKLQIQISEQESIFDANKINNIKEFTLTRTLNENKKSVLFIDNNLLNILRNAVLKMKSSDDEEKETPYFIVTDKNLEIITNALWIATPAIVFFDDFCDILPNQINISDLVNKTESVEGYKAVKNLEEIFDIDFASKDLESDAKRRAKEEADNIRISIDFQNDWGQRIHDQNNVKIKFDFQKREGEAGSSSYVNFYVETKDGVPLRPKRRSKGLIWFLSLWLELKAQNSQYGQLILLLDEPDQHLHIRAQKDILKLINNLGDKGNQIFYATHSPYLLETDHLNRINLIINSKKSGTTIEDITTSKINNSNKKDALQPIANAIGLSVSEFSSLDKNNVLLEGVSDFYYFLGMKELLEIDSSYSFIPGVGVRKIDNLISLCIGYGLNWVVIIDDDPRTGGTESQIKYEEIRDYIFDGQDDKTKEKVHVLNGIVGIENMFTYDDLKLIDSTIKDNPDKTKVVGKNRKVLFAKMFFEKVKRGDIKIENLSKTAKENFTNAFEYIKKHLTQ